MSYAQRSLSHHEERRGESSIKGHVFRSIFHHPKKKKKKENRETYTCNLLNDCILYYFIWFQCQHGFNQWVKVKTENNCFVPYFYLLKSLSNHPWVSPLSSLFLFVFQSLLKVIWPPDCKHCLCDILSGHPACLVEVICCHYIV